MISRDAIQTKIDTLEREGEEFYERSRRPAKGDRDAGHGDHDSWLLRRYAVHVLHELLEENDDSLITVQLTEKQAREYLRTLEAGYGLLGTPEPANQIRAALQR